MSAQAPFFLCNANEEEVRIARVAVSVDQDIMGGEPVFHGTRVPIDIILGSLDDGTSFSELKDSYPFLTIELVEAAKIYVRISPRSEPQRSLGEMHPNWKLISKKILVARNK